MTVFATGDQLVRAIGERRGDETAHFRNRVRHALAAALLEIEEATGLGCDSIGLNCWMTSWWLRHLAPYRVRKWVPRWLKRRVPKPRLHRVERLRLSGWPRRSHVGWTRDKGIIGLCWRERCDVGLNCFEEYAELLAFDDAGRPQGVSCTKEHWDTEVPEEVKLGLTYEEFKQIAGKYGAVVVTPMFVDDEFVGVVTLDVPWGDHYAKLWTERVRRALGDAAEYAVDPLIPANA